jgi:hypothetical protein
MTLKCWLKSDVLFIVRLLAFLVLLYYTGFPGVFVVKRKEKTLNNILYSYYDSCNKRLIALRLGSSII